jgi:hypothetical protein
MPPPRGRQNAFAGRLESGRAWVCRPTGENLPIQSDEDPSAFERLSAAARKQPDRHAALICLAQALPSLETPSPGLRNEGCVRSARADAGCAEAPGVE